MATNMETFDDDVLDVTMPDGPKLRLKRLAHGAGMPLPYYATDGAAGLDICTSTMTLIETRDVRMVPTGFAIEIPPGYEVQVRSRSGLANEGIVVANSPGTIDSDYRGEIKVLLANIGRRAQVLQAGDRVAQLVIAKVERLPVIEVRQLSATARGGRGFGSTGR